MKKTAFGPLGLVAALLLGIHVVGGHQWFGGDTIPNSEFLRYTFANISANTSSWGLPGPSTGFAFINSLPFGFGLTILKWVFNSYADSIYFGFMFYIFCLGWFKLFNTRSEHKLVCVLAVLCLFGSPYSWFLLNRNVYFQHVLLSVLPWLLLVIRDLSATGGPKNWVKFAAVFGFASPSFVNPGYALPLTIFIFLYTFFYTDLFTKPLRLLGAFGTAVAILSPVIYGFLNLFLKSEAISDDYWNNIVLTAGPLEIQKTKNVLSNVLVGYNIDTLSAYGYIEGSEYFPFWAANLQDTFIGMMFFVPVFLVVVMYLRASSSSISLVVAGWLAISLLLLFVIKASAPPFGGLFFDLLSGSGLFKMFRGPHIKFGYLYSVVSLLIILELYKHTGVRLRAIVVVSLSGLAISSAVFPLAARLYIPQLNLVKSVPTDYYEVCDFLTRDSADGKSINLGVILPANGSTWHSNSWGYEGYHILNWICPKVSFLNRNGIAFNSQNKIAFEALPGVTTGDAEAVDVLAELGFTVLIYDKTTDNRSRFFSDDFHNRNLASLDSFGAKLVKIFENGALIVYAINRAP